MDGLFLFMYTNDEGQGTSLTWTELQVQKMSGEFSLPAHLWEKVKDILNLYVWPIMAGSYRYKPA